MKGFKEKSNLAFNGYLNPTNVNLRTKDKNVQQNRSQINIPCTIANHLSFNATSGQFTL